MCVGWGLSDGGHLLNDHEHAVHRDDGQVVDGHHPCNIATLYHPMSPIRAKRGQKLSKSSLISLLGKSFVTENCLFTSGLCVVCSVQLTIKSSVCCIVRTPGPISVWTVCHVSISISIPDESWHPYHITDIICSKKEKKINKYASGSPRLMFVCRP